jgi:hypothetical protein
MHNQSITTANGKTADTFTTVYNWSTRDGSASREESMVRMQIAIWVLKPALSPSRDQKDAASKLGISETRLRHHLSDFYDHFKIRNSSNPLLEPAL